MCKQNRVEIFEAEKATAKKCGKIAEAMGHYINWTDKAVEIAFDNNMWMLRVSSPKQIFISFNVNICPSIAAKITKYFSFLAEGMGIKVRIDTVYALKIGEDNKLADIVTGQDAYDLVGREPNQP